VDPAVLARMGLFVADDVLDADALARLRAEMQASRAEPATVTGEGRNYVDAEQRSTKYAKVSDDLRAGVARRVESLKTRIEEHFGIALGDLEKPQFLVYEPGDFFGVHRDSSEDEDAADYARARRVSVVVFVNEEYEGGQLEFYGLLEAKPDVGLPLDARPGLAVAFRSETPHGVAAVTSGERYTVASWFTAP
jgi:predicted 2-oxoglutarate/Fe(II)-dependent dioxygenase YbiX